MRCGVEGAHPTDKRRASVTTGARGVSEKATTVTPLNGSENGFVSEEPKKNRSCRSRAVSRLRWINALITRKTNLNYTHFLRSVRHRHIVPHQHHAVAEPT